MAQRQILRKLYLTAFWLLAAFAAVCIGVTVIDQVMTYMSEQRAVAEWRATYEGYQPPPSAYVDDVLPPEETWKLFGPHERSLSDRGLTLASSLLALIPLGLLVAGRRWALWLLRPEPIRVQGVAPKR